MNDAMNDVTPSASALVTTSAIGERQMFPVHTKTMRRRAVGTGPAPSPVVLVTPSTRRASFS